MIVIKSYNGLYDNMIRDKNIQLAIINAGRNKYKNNRRHRKLRHLRANANEYADTVRKWLDNFEPSKHTPIEINDGISAKKRQIIVPTVKEVVIHHIVRTTDHGIPLGFTTSQWFANFLLTELDHKIKEDWNVKYYIRFMDDMVLFGSNKRELHRVRKLIAEYLETELHLQLKKNWQLFYLDSDNPNKKGRFLDFLGFRFYRHHVGLRRKLALKIQRKAKHIYRKSKANIHDARQMVTYAGLTKYADCRDWFRIHVLRYVSIRYLRKKISRYDKRRLMYVV